MPHTSLALPCRPNGPPQALAAYWIDLGARVARPGVPTVGCILVHCAGATMLYQCHPRSTIQESLAYGHMQLRRKPKCRRCVECKEPTQDEQHDGLFLVRWSSHCSLIVCGIASTGCACTARQTRSSVYDV